MTGLEQVLGPPKKCNSINIVDKVVICFQFKKKPYKEELSVSVVFDPKKWIWGGVGLIALGLGWTPCWGSPHGPTLLKGGPPMKG